MVGMTSSRHATAPLGSSVSSNVDLTLYTCLHKVVFALNLWHYPQHVETLSVMDQYFINEIDTNIKISVPPST
jgi:hypothetical protein